MGSPIQRSITTRSGMRLRRTSFLQLNVAEFVPGSSTTYSQGQQLQFATSPVLGSSSISNSYGSSATLRDYSGANAASVEGAFPLDPSFLSYTNVVKARNLPTILRQQSILIQSLRTTWRRKHTCVLRELRVLVNRSIQVGDARSHRLRSVADTR
jgi:hypothetical protein